MANFKPINQYTFFLLNKLIKKYGIKEPFLDVGCGVGDLSIHLGNKNWRGKAIDYSEKAIKIAQKRLKRYPKIKVEKKNIFKEHSTYNSVFLWDVIEHFKDDTKIINKLNRLINNAGFLVMAVPSNPKEWAWDDDFYGHYRRYDYKNIKTKLKQGGIDIIEIWDFTYPFFWFMRKFYLNFKKPLIGKEDKSARTRQSSILAAWKLSFVSRIINNSSFLWTPIYILQYLFFRKLLNRGFSFLVIGQKVKKVYIPSSQR